MTELAATLGTEQSPAILRAFAQAFICSMPTGKQNTFANRTLPDAVYLTVREDQPVNLCGAFEKAVPPSANGFMEPSVMRFVSYAKQIYTNFTGEPAEAFVIGKGMEELSGASMTMNSLLDALEDAVRRRLPVGEVS